MAKTILNPALGRISGLLGNFVYRNRNGKTFLSRRPCYSSTQPSIEVVNRRKHFGNNARLSSAIIKLPEVSSAWEKKTYGNYTGYNLLSRANYNFVTPDDVQNGATIFPDFGAYFSERTVKVTKSSVKLVLNSDDQHFENKENSFFIKLLAIICCKDKNVDTLKDLEFIECYSSLTKINRNKTFRLIFSLPSAKSEKCSLKDFQKSIYNDYESHSFLLAFVVYDKNNQFLAHSETLFINTMK